MERSIGDSDSQIQFVIDITDEVNAVKAASNGKIRKLTIKNTNVVESQVNDKTLKKSNVEIKINDNCKSRYYGRFYTRLDDSCIVDVFGKRAINKRYHARFGNQNTFYKFKRVEKFDIDKMYQYLTVGENNERIAMEIKEIGYVLVDCISYSCYSSEWTCGILMKYEQEEKT